MWWDTNLTSGEVFREVIDRELAAADAVIVIWTAHSVASNWVVSEAGDAARRGKLITVRTGDLEPWRIPKPYNTYHTDLVDNRTAVLAAVRRLAGEPPKPEIKPSRNLSEATLHEALALEHWQAIKTSADPTKLRSFLNEFGETKCAPLARTEFERLAAREWRKLVNSKDIRAIHGFCLVFQGTPQNQIAQSRIAVLSETIEGSLPGASGQNKFGDLLNRHSIAGALRETSPSPRGQRRSKNHFFETVKNIVVACCARSIKIRPPMSAYSIAAHLHWPYTRDNCFRHIQKGHAP